MCGQWRISFGVDQTNRRIVNAFLAGVLVSLNRSFLRVPVLCVLPSPPRHLVYPLATNLRRQILFRREPKPNNQSSICDTNGNLSDWRSGSDLFEGLTRPEIQ